MPPPPSLAPIYFSKKSYGKWEEVYKRVYSEPKLTLAIFFFKGGKDAMLRKGTVNLSSVIFEKKKGLARIFFCPRRYLWEGVMSVVVLFSST